MDIRRPQHGQVVPYSHLVRTLASMLVGIGLELHGTGGVSKLDHVVRCAARCHVWRAATSAGSLRGSDVLVNNDTDLHRIRRVHTRQHGRTRVVLRLHDGIWRSVDVCHWFRGSNRNDPRKASLC